ncbi:hypothetical protein IB655_06180 [Francisella noatunensis]|uniref:Uncharacterized protein n=2 Tax=Francisella noatunensis TaxID=657445 RepID=A0A9Q2QE41_9GAMM|nr:hypothetical protein [Francisella noatunensis]MBK2028639.1 hypothetical protein [Francisella noatunensis]MBK2034074.1 hypothetical protein [Francisella noatunensis]MBK2048998.1 hypothetical protein [Francisella noatunensis]MBK2050394.1 hypothetical protein [Francisella noatunensis]MBK2051872.1 hypothetical protein [Francisella noatunensis]
MQKRVLKLVMFVCLNSMVNFSYADNSSECDSVPSMIKQFKGADQDNWIGYRNGDFVRYDNKVYQLKNDWWTADTPDINQHWIYCQDVLQPAIYLYTPSRPAYVSSTSKPHVIIYDSNHNQVADLKNLKWGATKKVRLPIGQFTIVVEGIDSSQGYASQSIVNLAMGQSKKISVNYKNIHAVSLSIYPKAAISGSVGVKILDSKGTVVYQGSLVFNKKNTIYDIDVTKGKYMIHANSYIVAGKVYKAPDTLVSLSPDETTNVNLNFDSWSVAAARVDVAVTDLPKDREVKLKFMNNTGDVQTVSIKGNGVYTQMFDKDGSTWHLIADGIDGVNIYPKSFNASQSCVNASVKSVF